MLSTMIHAETKTKSSTADPLVLWQDQTAKKTLMTFVRDVTDPESKKYVTPEDRVAVFDNDGTLWTEQPLYTQLLFTLNRVKELAPKHPEWKTEQPFKAILEHDEKTLKSMKEGDIAKLVAVTHAGMTEEQFEKDVDEFFKNQKHPQKKMNYTDMVYQPMVELIRYLQKNDFKVFIVTGGGVEFVRAFSEPVYGVPKENVIGSNLQYEYKSDGKTPELLRKAELVPPVDDKIGKPVHIQREIGRRPILAFGNSDGDFEMLKFTTESKGPRLGLILHHDDSQREYAYDKESRVGHLEEALDAAKREGWIVVSMKKDFKTVY